jgi:predicted metal-dependent hydrolase
MALSLRLSSGLFKVLKKLGYVRVRKVRVAPRKSRSAYLKHRETARALVKQRLEYFNSIYGFTIGKIAIRDQRSRWGSCSRKGNLNFNYRIALIPLHLADYIVVHELCHLKEFNHSKQFWDLVARAVPDHAACRKALHSVGTKVKPTVG